MALVVEKLIKKCECYSACGSLGSVIFLVSKVAISALPFNGLDSFRRKILRSNG